MTFALGAGGGPTATNKLNTEKKALNALSRFLLYLEQLFATRSDLVCTTDAPGLGHQEPLETRNLGP